MEKKISARRCPLLARLTNFNQTVASEEAAAVERLRHRPSIDVDCDDAAMAR